MIIEIVKYLAVWTILWLGSFNNVYLVHKNFLKQLKQVTDKVIWGIFSLCVWTLISNKNYNIIVVNMGKYQVSHCFYVRARYIQQPRHIPNEKSKELFKSIVRQLTHWWCQ